VTHRKLLQLNSAQPAQKLGRPHTSSKTWVASTYL
jgi:hypothetical protein